MQSYLALILHAHLPFVRHPEHEHFLEENWLYEAITETYFAYGRNLVGAFRKFQESGKLEIITTAATHALLPMLANHPPSIRAQILVARDHYRSCFGCDPRGIWLPECAQTEGVET